MQGLEVVDAREAVQVGACDGGGAVLARLERWEPAEQAFLEASRLEPEAPTYVQNLARLYHRTGEVAARDSALVRWRALTALDSTATVDKD